MGRQADNSSEKRTLEPIIDDETMRRLWDEAQKATPDHVLETQLHDSRIPKPEIVHYASRKIKALEEEVERLRSTIEGLWESLREVESVRDEFAQCCTQRGARMQIMREWLDSGRGIGPPTEWWYFCEERPNAKDWFDEDGVPK